MYLCPKCKTKLSLNGNNLQCQNGHCYDRAKQGYYNLLLCNGKNSKNPGDNLEMVNARCRFLSKGFYLNLRDAILEEISKLNLREATVVDVGCGEGYYTHTIKSLEKVSKVYGVDVSKFAIKKAASNYKEVNFCVASVFSLPFGDGVVDVITRVFAPLCKEEYSRVLNGGGYLIEVEPGEQHLIELKNALYENVYVNKEKHANIDGFTLQNKINVKYTFTVLDRSDVVDLFYMTPYLYKTEKSATDKLLNSDIKEITADFTIYVSRKDV